MPALASCSTIWGGVPGLNPLPPAPFHRGRLLFTRISGAASNFLKRSRTVAYARDETESNRRGGQSGFRPMRRESDRRRSELNILDAKTEPMSVSPLMERGIILSERGPESNGGFPAYGDVNPTKAGSTRSECWIPTAPTVTVPGPPRPPPP